MKAQNMIIGLFMSLIALLPESAYGQACPACSNPSLQSSEKLEAGLDTLYKGEFRVTLNVTNGLNYQGGHSEYSQLTPENILLEGGLHEHLITLDFVRNELALEYTFKKNWSWWLRIPYDIKIQRVDVNFVDNFTPKEKADILRNRDIHHREETYTGISDMRLFVSRRINKFLGENGRLDIALGSSLPVGKTESNPLVAGNEGRKHLHIQFGTGTFDPLLELHYVASISRKWSLAVFTMNKFSFYKNSNNYQGSFETTTGISLGYRLQKGIALRGTLANFSQSQAKWNGVADPNSGLISFNGSISPSFRLNNGLAITPGYRFPIYQKTISDAGDVFEYGPTFVLNISFLFNRKDKLSG